MYKISIIMGIFNCAKTLPEAIESIINQTYKNWEFIMCDDGSTDNTYEIAKKYSDKYPEKIILIKNENNSGLAYSLNQCLKYATGEFIARMDGDDMSRPERFEKEMDYLLAHPEYDLVGCAMQRFNEVGLADIVGVVNEPDYYTLRKRVPFNHATIIARRKVYDELNGYTVSDITKRCEDLELWFRFYKAGFKGNNIPDALYLVREDSSAIRRRTAITRFKALKVRKNGYKLLEYPSYWLIKPIISESFKAIIPFKVVEVYRKIQKKNQ